MHTSNLEIPLSSQALSQPLTKLLLAELIDLQQALLAEINTLHVRHILHWRPA